MEPVPTLGTEVVLDVAYNQLKRNDKVQGYMPAPGAGGQAFRIGKEAGD